MRSDRVAFASDNPARRISPRAANAFLWVGDWISILCDDDPFIRISRADSLLPLLFDPRLISIFLCGFGPRLAVEDFEDVCRIRIRARRLLRPLELFLTRLIFIMRERTNSSKWTPDVKRCFRVRPFAAQKT
jgi:hypothetical protein